jgi:hypothetical protein
MSPQNTRILKEARTLFWPWCVLMSFGVFRIWNPLALDLRFGEVSFVAFYLGFPFLIALSFGDEFQNRTFSMLLTEPVSRLQIWRDKMSVLLVAVVSTSLVYYVSWRTSLEEGYTWFIPVAFLIASLGCGVFWTLVTRSTIGGVFLNLAVQGVIFAILMGILEFHLVFESFGFLLAYFAGIVCCSAIMFWLGYRQLVRFEATGEGSNTDLFARGLKVIPDTWAESFHWRPAGPTLNLIKKELRLLRPVWLITLLAAGLLLAAAPFRLVIHLNPDYLGAYGIGVTGMYLVLAMILIGAVSMGEERQLGTHSMNLTLPVSLKRQWFIKLFTNTLAGFVGIFLVVGIGRLVFGYLLFSGNPKMGYWDFFLTVMPFPLLTLAAFWSACAVNGTVRATVAVFPVALSVWAAAFAGSYVAEMKRMASAIDWIVLNAHPFHSPWMSLLMFYGYFGPIVLFIPLAAVLIFQTYRLFRIERRDNIKSVLRYLIPLWLVAFFCVFSLQLLFGLTISSNGQINIVFREVVDAVDKLQLDPAKLDAAHPQPITFEDLNKVYSFSKTSRSWLAGAGLSVSPRPDGHFFRVRIGGVWREADSPYSANIYFTNGWDCRLYSHFFSCQASDGTRWAFPRVF